MVVTPVSDRLVIKSHKGEYTVLFDEDAMVRLNSGDLSGYHFIIDEKVAALYKDELNNIVSSKSVLIIEANEENKSLDKFPYYIEKLVSHEVRRNHILIAIGGGVIQDIVCFLAATLLRGLKWYFYPTTLLAQADSCIGSKSSINVGKIKNILGTFTPPEQIYICLNFLKTLEEREIHSGIGEMLKVHAIDSPESFNRIASDYENMLTDFFVIKTYITKSLEIKKAIIELDEFDKGPRNVMNYGHTFGHAIESATDFAIPHGIAVSMGMDMANFVAVRLGLTEIGVYERMYPILQKNLAAFEKIEIPTDKFFSAILKDKKNTDEKLRLIMPDRNSKIVSHLYPNNSLFQKVCAEYLTSGRMS
jgi:3-dehydroquinate synthase